MSDFFPDNLPEAFVYSEYFGREEEGEQEEIKIKPPSKFTMAVIYIFVALLLLAGWMNT